MRLLRRLLFASILITSGLAPLGCGSAPVAEVEEKPSWVGKKVVVKRGKTKQYLFTSDGRIRQVGEFVPVMGTVKAEERKEEVDYVLVSSGRDEFWLKNDDLIWFEDVHSYFDKELTENPKSYEHYMIRGQMFADLGKWNTAIEDYTEALKCKTNLSVPLYARAKAYEQIGEVALALNDYERIIKIEPSNINGYVSRARCLDLVGETDKALIDLDRAIKIEPKNPFCLVTRAKVWANKGQHQAAEMDFDRALAAQTRNPDTFVARGEFYLKQKKHDKAHADFAEALKIDADNANAMIGQSLILAAGHDPKLRDAKKAMELAVKANDLTSGRNAKALEALAVASAATGKYTDADKYQKQALEDPQYAKLNGDIAKKRLTTFSSQLPFTLE